MLYPSLLLLASAGAAVAQLPTACENFANATELLQADEGKAYCSSILSFGTVTNTIAESTTTQETTTLTTPFEITETETTTQTETISSGTFTETAPLFWVTETATVSTTEYACPTFFKRGLEAYAAQKTTNAPEPTSAPVDFFSDDCEDDEDSETSPAESEYHSPTYMTVYPASAPQGKVLTLSYAGHSTVPSNAQYTQAHGNAPAAYSASAIASSYSHSAAASNAQYSQAYGNGPAAYSSIAIDSYSQSSYANGQPHISGNSSIHYSAGVTASSSRIFVSHVSSNSTVIPTAGPTVSSVIFTTSPMITPTPAPKPSCETAPTALRTGFPCDAISAACGCLGLASATEDATSTTTFTETSFVTEAMLITTTTTLTETAFTTVPEATLTESPSSTTTATATATASVCPCSGSTSSLCGTTPDTCKNLQTDLNNCGSCGNTCADGDYCSAGVCKTPTVPNVQKCVESRCENYITCSAGGSCLCIATAEGTGACVSGSSQCTMQTCAATSDCKANEVCAINTCCGKAICVSLHMVCPNDGSTSRMFRRKSWDGKTIGGGK
ncbi:hypothetical protein Q7P35_003157 [Cladosporium inversicolor]